MAQVQTSSTVHDVVIIGSGAGGGTVTKVLADLGVRVLLIEAGPMVAMTDFKMLHSPADVWHRGAGERAQLGTDGPGHADQLQRRVRGPTPPMSPTPWRRAASSVGSVPDASAAARITTGVVQLRYSDYDFKPRSFDGLGWDWPIRTIDMALYYDKAERLIGVTGKPEGHPQRT